MKKYFVFVLLTIFVFSCSKDRIALENKEENISALTTRAENIEALDLLGDYEYLGVIHNEGLEYVLTKLKLLEGNYTMFQIDSLSQKYLLEYFLEKDLDTLYNIEGVINQLYTFDVNKEIVLQPDSLNSQILFNTFNMDSNMHEYLSDLLNSLKGAEKMSDFENIIKEKYLDEFDNWSQEEKKTYAGLTVVGMYSSEFWLNNYTAWRKLTFDLLGAIEYRDCRHNTKQDLKDAASVVSWDAAGLLAGPLAPEAAIIGSVGACLSNFFNYIIDCG